MGYLPEVVRIIAAHVNGAKAIGTGFFLSVDGKHIQEEGLLLTNAHVVTDSPVVKIMTTFIEHQALPVTVVSVCHDRDLALLKVEPQVQQYMKRVLYARYNLDHIPSFGFGDSDTLRTGYEVHAVGHPLGLIDQQFTTGQYQGPVHINAEIRGLSAATINGGNSGGPLLGTFEAPNAVPVKGLHYFQPTKYKVMGINTFKLTGANVDGENGFIHANTVKMALPSLVAPLKTRYEREKAVTAMVQKMYGHATPLATAIADHLTDETCAFLHTNLEEIDQTWREMKIGGMAGGSARSFMSWVGRHVIMPGQKHMHRGGPELLVKTLDFIQNKDWEGLMEWKNGRRWGVVRQAEVGQKKETLPVVVRMLPPPPSHIHSPIVGIESHPIYTADILAHYQCPEKDGKYVAQGGVLVNYVRPKSLFAHAGGQAGDIVFRFENENVTADLSAAGTWYSEKRDLPLSLTDLCNDTPIDAKITLHVLRKSEGVVQVSFDHRMPKYDELPEIRRVYSFCDEGRLETKQKAQAQGIVFAPLRLHHVGRFKLLDYMKPNMQHQFRVVIEAVSPESPAYASDAVRAGSILTHINDQPVANTWEEVQAQLAKGHETTNCWVIDTDYNGTSSKFVTAVRRNLQAK